MDEIDAALDFRNVSIVAHYIKERTKNAQFIIISLRSVVLPFCPVQILRRDSSQKWHVRACKPTYWNIQDSERDSKYVSNTCLISLPHLLPSWQVFRLIIMLWLLSQRQKLLLLKMRLWVVPLYILYRNCIVFAPCTSNEFLFSSRHFLRFPPLSVGSGFFRGKLVPNHSPNVFPSQSEPTRLSRSLRWSSLKGYAGGSNGIGSAVNQGCRSASAARKRRDSGYTKNRRKRSKGDGSFVSGGKWEVAWTDSGFVDGGRLGSSEAKSTEGTEVKVTFNASGRSWKVLGNIISV